MSLVATLRYVYLGWFSKPAGDRTLYRAVRQRPVSNILELGIGSLPRTLRLIDWAIRCQSAGTPAYSAVDEFELRAPSEGEPAVSLKEAYRQLRAAGVRVRLTPGLPGDALARKSHELLGVDLLLISAQYGDSALESAWYYLPRMLTTDARIYRERVDEAGESHWESISRAQIEQLAKPDMRRLNRRHAA